MYLRILVVQSALKALVALLQLSQLILGISELLLCLFGLAALGEHQLQQFPASKLVEFLIRQ